MPRETCHKEGFRVYSNWNLNRTAWNFNNINRSLSPSYCIQVNLTVFSDNIHSPLSYCKQHEPSPVILSRAIKKQGRENSSLRSREKWEQSQMTNECFPLHKHLELLSLSVPGSHLTTEAHSQPHISNVQSTLDLALRCLILPTVNLALLLQVFSSIYLSVTLLKCLFKPCMSNSLEIRTEIKDI